MRYESFYPFSQNYSNGFFNASSPPPVNSPSPSPNTFNMPTNFIPGNQPMDIHPSQNYYGMPSNSQMPQQNSFLSNLQQGILGSFQQGGNRSAGGFGGQGGAPQGPQAQGPQAQGPQVQGPQPNRTMSYLQTADKFLNTAQQITPMIRQYAPMFQNVPALWKLYRGFQSIPGASAAPGIGAAAGPPSIARAAASAISSGTSKPRIFQPPF